MCRVSKHPLDWGGSEAYLAFLAVGDRGLFSTLGMDHSGIHRNSLGDNLRKKGYKYR